MIPNSQEGDLVTVERENAAIQLKDKGIKRKPYRVPVWQRRRWACIRS
jgi:hypothetical protein